MEITAAERRRRRRRVADENRRRAPRAETLSVPGEQARIPLPDQQQSPTPPNQAENASSGNVAAESHEVLSPASVISHRLSKHVIADQSKRIFWPSILSRLREAFSLDPQPAPEERDMVAMQARMIRQKGLHPSELSKLQVAIDAFPPRAVADFLLAVFMKHATDVFFYFDQSQMLADMNELYTDQYSPLRFDPAFICLAMATFALGSQWTPLERPERLESSQQKEYLDVGSVFFSHAKALIPEIIERSCLRSVQAPFVLGVYLMPACAVGTSYVYLGLAVRKALVADLHLEVDDHSMSQRDKEIRRRLWWSIYSLERCTTTKLNRACSVDAKIITAALPSQCASLDRSQVFDNLQCQIAYARLIKILDKIAGSGDGSSELGWLPQSKWEAGLKEWKRSLPADFRLDHFRPSDLCYRAVAHLYLNYYYAWITIGKVSLVTVAKNKLGQAEFETSEASDKAKKMASSCTKAARKVLRLFESLMKNRKITRFSFTDFQGCSIATIITLVSGILERDSGYDARVEFGLKCLQRMAIGNMAAQLGVRFVEAVQTITNEAVAKLERVRAISEDTSNMNISSGYDEWTEWLTMQEDPQRREQASRSGLETSSGGDHRAEKADPWRILPVISPRGAFTFSASRGEEIVGVSTASRDSSHLDSTMEPWEPFEYDFLSDFRNDEQAFLMGLTGLDALDFSGLTV
ncbi:hypothetical protein N7532_005288 [Penicillium argentinense]|uniref:Xylanolytic transcriptional activator regulatory domain-containing protein n=1 Tax=Penicillium argentinense TaxID=1131581 RepID=A0A9W9FE75_9EURO|nr:uncharacterized protein N7532_005288 [Penicillium argentinense]KAJ5098287.1 hypothetical protein N7532_005288 [Penicillium argentinense]